MFKRHSEKFNRTMFIIYPGEFHVSFTDVIATILGSCIAVCIKDTKTGIGGMNHFILPGDVRSNDIFLAASSKYGMFAMEQLINEIIRRGGSKKDFQAKVFGGGHVLNLRKSEEDVPELNINFARAFLKMEQIDIVKEDVGGFAGRKILFFPDTARVLLKRLTSTANSKIIMAEKVYKEKLLGRL
jgi:chemotaxis protein CheD